uniref:Uncharacterized protein n=1 Tax=Anolis carolinensis TaxID=28377 RepID=A0A803THV9_ANOCA
QHDFMGPPGPPGAEQGHGTVYPSFSISPLFLASAWNYSILGLSALVLVIGMGLLVANIKPAETEMKQAFVLLKDDSNPEALADSLLPQTQNAGEVSIHWKDGNVTALYEEKPEVDI